MKSGIVFLLCFALTSLQAQQNSVTAGGNGTGAGGSVSYSIGQIFCESHVGQAGSVSEGVQQPFEYFVVTSAGGAGHIDLQCSVYPNPARECVNLQVENYPILNFDCQLFGPEGKLLFSKRITDELTHFDMTAFPAGIYLLRVTQNGQAVKTFQIILN
jgi:hypothetical protein